MALRRLTLLLAWALLAGDLCAQTFRQEEVRLEFASSGDTQVIAGTLTLPTGGGVRVPAVVLITGSGAQDRDEELMGHRPFRVIAEYLSARGYAVLRCDDRGVGGSTGDMARATTLDFAADAAREVDYLQGRSEIDPRRIFLFGHSEGATVAAIVASGRDDVAGVAMLGGAGVDGKTLLLQQNEAIFRQRGLPDSLVGRRVACMRDIFALCDTLLPDTSADCVKTLNMALRPLFKRHSAGLGREQKQQAGLTSGECYGWAVTLATPWMGTFLSLNPAEYIARLRCPLLAIGGEQDCQVPAAENLGAIRQMCDGHHVPCTVVSLPGINHLGQQCRTGAVDEYATLGQAPAEAVLQALLSWLDANAR